LWQKSFRDDYCIASVTLNQEILIGRFLGSSLRLTCLSRTSGDILWELKDTPYHPGPALKNGYQCLVTDDGKSQLMFLPEQRWIWDAPKNVGAVVAGNNQFSSTGKSLTDTLFTSASAVHSKDAKILYSYPPEARFGCLSDTFVVLIRGDFDKPAGPAGNELLFIEKNTGHIKKTYPGKAYYLISKAAEDANRLYLIANYILDKQATAKATSDILILNKQTLDIQAITIGKNIPLFQIKIFPRDNLIFIPTYKDVGAYIIPEHVEHLEKYSN
jgi:hypothetical protein